MLSPSVHKAIKSSHHMNDYFTVFILSLMKLFSTDQQLLDDRGSFIIRYDGGSFIVGYDRGSFIIGYDGDHSLLGMTGSFIIRYGGG